MIIRERTPDLHGSRKRLVGCKCHYGTRFCCGFVFCNLLLQCHGYSERYGAYSNPRHHNAPSSGTSACGRSGSTSGTNYFHYKH
jgi:hypothetical protein